MVKLLLIKPPEKTGFDFGAFSLVTLAAAVRDMADVTILDATDLAIDDAADKAWAADPEMIGVTVMGLQSVLSAARFIHVLSHHPKAGGADIIAGGHGATVAPERILTAGADAVVLGEGEATLRDLLVRGIDEDVRPGTAQLCGDDFLVGPPRPLITPLDALPGPARELMAPPRDGVYLLETSRGCPHHCGFCETTRFHGSRWRPHTPAWVAEETARLVENHDAWVVLIADDNFAARPSRVIEICRLLSRGPLPATFIASARADDLARDPAVIPALASARIHRVMVGVETLEPEPASRVAKLIPPALYREVFERLAEHQIFSMASFIVGLPGESEDPDRLLELAVSAGSDAACFVPFLPMPGTPLAVGATLFEPLPVYVERAAVLTDAFRCHPAVRSRLSRAAESGGVREIMARATLENYHYRTGRQQV